VVDFHSVPESVEKTRLNGSTRTPKEPEGDMLPQASQPPERTIVLVDRRVLSRECLAHALKAADPGSSILSFSSAADWLEQRPGSAPACLVILHVNQGKIHGQELGRELALIKQAAGAPPVYSSRTKKIRRISSAL